MNPMPTAAAASWFWSLTGGMPGAGTALPVASPTNGEAAGESAWGAFAAQLGALLGAPAPLLTGTNVWPNGRTSAGEGATTTPTDVPTDRDESEALVFTPFAIAAPASAVPMLDGALDAGAEGSVTVSLAPTNSDPSANDGTPRPAAPGMRADLPTVPDRSPAEGLGPADVAVVQTIVDAVQTFAAASGAPAKAPEVGVPATAPSPSTDTTGTSGPVLELAWTDEDSVPSVTDAVLPGTGDADRPADASTPTARPTTQDAPTTVRSTNPASHATDAIDTATETEIAELLDAIGSVDSGASESESADPAESLLDPRSAPGAAMVRAAWADRVDVRVTRPDVERAPGDDVLRPSALDLGQRLASRVAAVETMRAISYADAANPPHPTDDRHPGGSDQPRALTSIASMPEAPSAFGPESPSEAVESTPQSADTTAQATGAATPDRSRSIDGEDDAAAPTTASTSQPLHVSERPAPLTATAATHVDLGARLRQAIAAAIVEEGKERLLDSVRGSFEAKIEVEPAHLGRVSIEVVRGADGGLNVLLAAVHEEAARALDHEVDDLVEDLARHRIEVNEVSVRHGEKSGAEHERPPLSRQSWQEHLARERREQEENRQRADQREQQQRRSRQGRQDSQRSA